MRQHWVLGLFVVGVLAVTPLVAEAAEHGGDTMSSGAKVTLSLTKDSTASPWTKETGYGNRVGQKLVFGVKNLLLGWTEFFTEPYAACQNKTNFLKGLGMGLKNGIEDELGGVVHILTFPVTSVDAPLPEGGVGS